MKIVKNNNNNNKGALFAHLIYYLLIEIPNPYKYLDDTTIVKLSFSLP